MSTLYIEVRPGEGGDDAVEFATDLLESLVRLCVRQGWTTVPQSAHRTLIVSLSLGATQLPRARQMLKSFAGVHRIQRTPSSEASRRHTSTATVAILDELKAEQPVLSERDLRIDRMRGSGTGGQRRNKVETAVRLTHVPTGIVITRTSGRSQATNIADAKDQLMQMLQQRAGDQAVHHQHASRTAQTMSSASSKDFTHCYYRDEVVRHADGRRWTVRAWRQGRVA